MLLQDVRREGKFAVPIIQEGLASLPGLKGELSTAPRAGGRREETERCMGGMYAGVWGALAERRIPVPDYGITAAGRWAVVGVGEKRRTEEWLSSLSTAHRGVLAGWQAAWYVGTGVSTIWASLFESPHDWSG